MFKLHSNNGVFTLFAYATFSHALNTDHNFTFYRVNVHTYYIYRQETIRANINTAQHYM